VYNVTKFLEDHPGGDDVLLSSTGKAAYFSYPVFEVGEGVISDFDC